MFIIHPEDNVHIDLESKYKVAAKDIKKGETIIKYGFPIGHATVDIKKGEYVHTDNMRTNLEGVSEFQYNAHHAEEIAKTMEDVPAISDCTKKEEAEDFPAIYGYIRKNGDVGIRNEVWIIPTVGCVNKLAEKLAKITGTYCFTHPYGCSQLGKDHETTRLILKGLVENPNAGGVLVLGLGCENNTMDSFQELLGEYDKQRVRFLVAQQVDDEIEAGVKIIEELKDYADSFQRQPVSFSKIKVGLKCGGSDGFSGITANPLVGSFSDQLIRAGGCSVLTEVPEMFGAEQILLNRCASREVFDKAVDMINSFKRYYEKNNMPIYENPSPGNKKGGISTLEEKSIGCVQKGGTSTVVDVLDYGDKVEKPGLSLLNGPGNDIVAITNLTAAGCQLILFTTGRGTPLGAPVPTIKISTNTELAISKKHWIDFDAGEMLDGKDLRNSLFQYVCKVINGEKTCNERNEYREIAIFKDGVTL